MNKLIKTTLTGLLCGTLSVSATVLVDVDNTSLLLTGATIASTFEGSVGRMPQGGTDPDVRYESVGVVDTDTVAVIATGSTKIDYYLDQADISGAGLDSTTYRYVQIDYSISGGDMVGIHKFRLGDTVAQAGSAGVNDPFADSSALDAIGGLAGSHSFIVDLSTYTDANPTSADWKYIRWNPFNGSDNDGITFTYDKITFGTGVTAVPEPSTMALVLGFVGLIAVAIRRRVGKA